MQSYITSQNFDVLQNVDPITFLIILGLLLPILIFFIRILKLTLLDGVSRLDFDHTSHLETAHEIWKDLNNFQQGTSNIEELRKDVFKKDYIKIG